MLSNDRHQKILERLEQRGSVSVNDLVLQFGISEMTVRRDLANLERKSLLRRVHGGAISIRGRSFEPPYLVRSNENREQKQAIGKAAAGLVRNGDSLSLDIGTTTLEVARFLIGKQDLTVITPSFPIGGLLAEQAGIRLILTGGILRASELSMTGRLAERVFQEFFVDKLFLAAGAIDLTAGLTEFNMEDTHVKRAMVQSAKEIILVADSSKFNRVAFTQIAPLSAVHRIITDKGLDPNLEAQLKNMGIDVIVADP